MGEGTKVVQFVSRDELDRVLTILEKLTDAVVSMRKELDALHDIRRFEHMPFGPLIKGYEQYNFPTHGFQEESFPIYAKDSFPPAVQ